MGRGSQMWRGLRLAATPARAAHRVAAVPRVCAMYVTRVGPVPRGAAAAWAPGARSFGSNAASTRFGVAPAPAAVGTSARAAGAARSRVPAFGGMWLRTLASMQLPAPVGAQRRAASTATAEPSLSYSSATRLFSLVVPVGGDPVEFRFHLADTVMDVSTRLSQEIGEPVTIMAHNMTEGGVVPSLLPELAARGFTIQIGDATHVIESVAFQGGLPRVSDGRVQLQALMQKSAYMRIRRLIESDPRRQMPYSEVLRTCVENGVPLDEAPVLVQQMHDLGILLHFQNSSDEHIKDTVFLKPEEVADSVFAEFGLMSPTQLFVQEESKKKEEQLAVLKAQLADLETLRDQLVAQATSAANMFSWAGFAFLTSGVAWYWWLCYVKFSWDIMEPVTYFTGAFFGIVGFIWWHHSSEEFEYGNMRNVWFKRRLKALYTNHGFDEARFDELVAKVAEVQAEVDTLDVTNYNPALISAYLSRTLD